MAEVRCFMMDFPRLHLLKRHLVTDNQLLAEREAGGRKGRPPALSIQGSRSGYSLGCLEPFSRTSWRTCSRL